MNGVDITLVHMQAKLGLESLLRIVDESDMIQSSSLGGLSTMPACRSHIIFSGHA